MMTREELILSGVPKSSRIIEIGPSHAPIAPRASGWNTKIIDHETREGLVGKYKGHVGVDLSRIEDVDFVWSGGLMRDAVPESLWGQFDVLVSSHSIEHMPDLLGFLASAQSLLSPAGIVVLAIPDKRYCFDFFQPHTTTGEILAAHREGRTRHSPRLAFDYHAYSVSDNHAIGFGHSYRSNLRFVHTLEEAAQTFETVVSGPDYLDLHAWRFTPSSFMLINLELSYLGLIDWRAEANPAIGHEFYARLYRGGHSEAKSLSKEELDAKRMSLLKQMMMEIRQQTDCLIPS